MEMDQKNYDDVRRPEYEFYVEAVSLVKLGNPRLFCMGFHEYDDAVRYFDKQLRILDTKQVLVTLDMDHGDTELINSREVTL